MDGAGNVKVPATNIQPRTDEAISFLRLFRPDGPWVLTAILPDTTNELKRTDTRTFRPKDESELRLWIDGYQGKHNIYFMVNPAKADLTKKAEKADVLAGEWLYIDVDPRPGEDIEIERTRAQKVVADKIAQKPTIVIDSGGGFQFFWLLSKPVELGSPEKIAQYEAYNRQLIHLTLADKNCFNVDRIMRLPGTINVPTKTKIKKGRVPVLARLVSIDTKLAHELKSFVPAVQVANAGERGGATRLAVSTSNLPKVDLEELALKHNLPPRLTSVIVRGDDINDPTRHGSRSEWLWYVCCDLVRHEVPPETILAIIMEPDFLISASVLDKPRPERYALKQVEGAMEKAISPELHELNQSFAVIGDWGGKCRILSEVIDHALGGRRKVSRQTFEDFRNRFMHRKVEVGKNDEGRPVFQQLGKWWLEHSKRRQYERLVFLPGRDGNPLDYNLWRGFACEAVPGDKHESFLALIRDVICSGVDEHYQYLIRWLARAVQFPDRPGEVAVAMRGKQGTGKSFMAKHFGSLFGQHYLQVADPKFLVGSFNSHLRDCIVLFGDEAFFAGDKKHESVLKTLVTEELITFEAKGIDAEAGPNFVHLLLASNEEWVVPAGMDDRRFFMLNVSDAQIKNTVYFGQIAHDLDNGGREALLHYLTTFELGDWKVQVVPQTDELSVQKDASLGIVESWWLDRLICGELIYDAKSTADGKTKLLCTADLTRAINADTKLRPVSLKRVGDFFKGRLRFERRDQTPAGVYVPGLAEARANWDRNVYPREWSNDPSGEWKVPERRYEP